MKYIVLDTNFMISALGFKIDIMGELTRICDFNFKPIVLQATLSELEKLIKDGEYFERKQATLALRFIQSRMDILPQEGYADEILAALDPDKYIIATQDADLAKKLRLKGFKLIKIRQKKHLIIQ
ncbi:MAG: PIN domain-containing protein [Candidatus Nanoarchaeia archaeon]|jgi:rRNA-processing protein FCF1